MAGRVSVRGHASEAAASTMRSAEPSVPNTPAPAPVPAAPAPVPAAAATGAPAERPQIQVPASAVTRLVLQYLRESKCIKAMRILEEEAGVLEDVGISENLAYLRSLIMDGQWEDAELFMKPLSVLTPGGNHGAGLSRDDLDRALFHVRKQAFLELRNSEETSGVAELVHALQDLEKLCSKREFNNLCFCLTLDSPNEHPDYREWTVYSGRLQCFERVRSLLASALERGTPVPAVPPQSLLRHLSNSAAMQLVGHVAKYPTASVPSSLTFDPVDVDWASRVLGVRGSGREPASPEAASRVLTTVQALRGVALREATEPELERRSMAATIGTIGRRGGRQSLDASRVARSTHGAPLSAADQAAVQDFLRRSLASDAFSTRAAELEPSDREALMRGISSGADEEAVEQPIPEEGPRTPKRQTATPAGSPHGAKAGPPVSPHGAKAAPVLAPAPAPAAPRQPVPKAVAWEIPWDAPADGAAAAAAADNGVPSSLAEAVAAAPAPRLGQRPTKPSAAAAQAAGAVEHKQAGAGRGAAEAPPTKAASTLWDDDLLQKMQVCAYFEDTMPIRTGVFHPHGSHFAIGCNSRAMRVIPSPVPLTGRAKAHATDPISLVPGHEWPLHHAGSLYTVDWSGDGMLLASGSNDALVHVVRAVTWEETPQQPSTRVCTLKPNVGTLRSVCFCDSLPGEPQALATAGGGDFAVRLWDVSRPTAAISQLVGHADVVFSIVAAGGGQLASSSADGTAKLWDIRTSKALASFQAPGQVGEGHAISVSGVDGCVAVGYVDGSVLVWDRRTGKVRASGPVHSADCRTVHYSPTGKALLTASFDGSVAVVKEAGGRLTPAAVFGSAHSDKVLCARWHPSLPAFITTGADKLVKYWAIGTLGTT